MEDSGNIYRLCKCGEHVMFDRECEKCGAESTTADDLAEDLRRAVKDEVPDPLGKMGQELRKRHRELVRKMGK